jgi:hypothetical protein
MNLLRQHQILIFEGCCINVAMIRFRFIFLNGPSTDVYPFSFSGELTKQTRTHSRFRENGSDNTTSKPKYYFKFLPEGKISGCAKDGSYIPF